MCTAILKPVSVVLIDRFALLDYLQYALYEGLLTFCVDLVEHYIDNLFLSFAALLKVGEEFLNLSTVVRKPNYSCVQINMYNMHRICTRITYIAIFERFY